MSINNLFIADVRMNKSGHTVGSAALTVHYFVKGDKVLRSTMLHVRTMGDGLFTTSPDAQKRGFPRVL